MNIDIDLNADQIAELMKDLTEEEIVDIIGEASGSWDNDFSIAYGLIKNCIPHIDKDTAIKELHYLIKLFETGE